MSCERKKEEEGIPESWKRREEGKGRSRGPNVNIMIVKAGWGISKANTEQKALWKEQAKRTKQKTRLHILIVYWDLSGAMAVNTTMYELGCLSHHG